MADKIRVNYPALQEMSKNLLHVAQELQRVGISVYKIEPALQAGVLQGEPGEVLGTAMQLLGKKTIELTEAVYKVKLGIDAAIGDMQAADGTAAGDFK